MSRCRKAGARLRLSKVIFGRQSQTIASSDTSEDKRSQMPDCAAVSMWACLHSRLLCFGVGKASRGDTSRSLPSLLGRRANGPEIVNVREPSRS